MTESALASGTYEVLRNRLREAASELRQRFEKLHAERAAVFGNIQTRLNSTAHVTTDHNCIPRDLFATETHILLGYNVQFGLKTEIHPSDVFAYYRFDGQQARQDSLEPLLSEAFRRDFQELYRYYRNATFLRFFQNGPLLYMVFQTGKTTTSFKAFKWTLEGQSLRYVDNRSEADVRAPAQHAFLWKRASRESHRHGAHPHISIEEKLFVDCVHGDLTIKVEDNTEDGLGIYREPVDSPDQTLDDAETFYAIVGNLVLLKIRPYQERDYRYLVFSTKRTEVKRLDSIGSACSLLPDDYGIIFPNGFVLQTGIAKLFDHGLTELAFDRLRKSPNGEDFLYLFYHAASGTYLQLRYNLIRQEVDTPMICHGQAFRHDGVMISMRAGDTPQKHHALQVWQTPFIGPDYRPTVQSESLLFKIGNHDLVRGMAECQELLSLIDKDESYADLYADLAKRAADVLDGYFWLDRDEVFVLSEPVRKIRDAATAAVDEFEKVVRARQETSTSLAKTQADTVELLKTIDRARFERINDFVDKLAAIRTQRGAAVQLRELRYIELTEVEQIESQLVEAADRLGVRCVQFLLSPKSLQPFDLQIENLTTSIPSITTSATGKQLDSEFEKIGSSLELLIETISQLKIDDLAQRTTIIDGVGDCLSQLNRGRSTLRMRLRDLTTSEMEADFASQSKLLDQSTAGVLDTADLPEKVDAALTRVLMQIEELEGRYADSETLLLRLTEKRQSICDTFESKRQQLVEVRTRRANTLVAAADRILAGIGSKTARIDELAELSSYFASDLMVEKVRRIADQLLELGDSVRREDVLSRLKTIADDSVRQQRDRRELLSDGNRAIKLGQHSFSVNHHAIELTTVVREGRMHLHLTGTQFFEPLNDPALDLARELWNQPLPSESPTVYRGEYLAFTIAENLITQSTTSVGLNASAFLALDPASRIVSVRETMQVRYQEGYARGVHDADAANILAVILESRSVLGLLAFSPKLRSLAWYVWDRLVPNEVRMVTEEWLSSFGLMDRMLTNTQPNPSGLVRLQRLLKQFDQGMLRGVSRVMAANYLLGQIQVLQPHRLPCVHPRATEIVNALKHSMPDISWKAIASELEKQRERPVDRWQLAQRIADGLIGNYSIRFENETNDPAADYREEVVLQLLLEPLEPSASETNKPSTPKLQCTIEALSGDHPRISRGSMPFHYHEFQERLTKHVKRHVSVWAELKATKQRLIEQAEKRLRSHEFKATVLTSFVRNQLIDQVYLPRIGDNMAKQLGALGDNKRTDRMGLLLLISPPGYGKTTLMEYVANRLGLVFVKVNGPAIGHSVTSLDPSEATNASAREEVQRINLALEMGDNTMLYLDDIQHCNVELLQKFIPLCDATRRIEGVWNGQSKTYDLRGRKFAVVMAGNPYNESGERFQIPDMLANRADVYNLGEIIGDSREAFELSYLENCLTSNTVLQPLARCSNADQRAVIAAATRGTTEGLSLESNLSPDSVQDMMSVLSKLNTIRDVVLMMNREYIRSASQADDYRTEPPFKLQGSYRNMNRIAEKVVPVMNEDELRTLILSSYQQDAQTLSRDGESNMLKFKELSEILTAEEQKRWNSIKSTFAQKTKLKGLSGEDSTAQVLASVMSLKDGLDAIQSALIAAMDQRTVEANKPPVDPRVVVQHSVPRVMTELIRSQFQLLYDGLRPLLENASHQTHTQERLRAAIETCLQRYRELEKEASEAEESKLPDT